MARAKFLKTIIDQASLNGFNFEHWYAGWLGAEWQSKDLALDHLALNRNYYALLFSHDFAHAFWKQGSRMTFVVPSATYMRRNPSGVLIEITRKPHTRRRLKPDAWKYHLREMACAEEPLRYIRRFVTPEATAKPSGPRRMLHSPSPQSSYFQK